MRKVMIVFFVVGTALILLALGRAGSTAAPLPPGATPGLTPAAPGLPDVADAWSSDRDMVRDFDVPNGEMADVAAPAQVASYAENVKLVGQVGGHIHAVAVQGHYAYVGVGPRLVILDVSNPAQPVAVGRTAVLPDIIDDIAVVDDTAYVVGGYSLVIVDVSNPAAPIVISSTSGGGQFYEKVVAAEPYVYAAGEYCLEAFDVSDPSNPLLISGVGGPGERPNIAIEAHTLYATHSWQSGVLVYDTSNPADLQLINSYEGVYAGRGIAVRDHIAYIADFHPYAWSLARGLRIVDFSDPLAPFEMAFYVMPGDPTHISLVGNMAYVLTRDSLVALDVTDPSAPSQVSSYEIHGYFQGLVVTEGLAYIIDEDGLYIVDVSDPAAPGMVGHYASGMTYYGATVVGDTAYLPYGYGLSTIDVSSPATPTIVGDITYGFGTSFCTYCSHEVVVKGNIAYVAAGDPRLHILDVSDPAAPGEAGFFRSTEFINSLALEGSMLYAAGSLDGQDPEGNYTSVARLSILDIATPITPSEAGFYETPGDGWDVAVVGDIAYLAAGEAGLRLIDVSDPATPREIGAYPGVSTEAVTVVGNYAYVHVGYNSLHILDISNPQEIKQLGSYAGPQNSIEDVVVSGNYAYIVFGTDLVVLDVSDPTAPWEVGAYDLPSPSYVVTVSGRLLYMPTHEGLFILRHTPGLAIRKTGPEVVAAGDQIGYVLSVENRTSITMTHLLITDALAPSAIHVRGGVLSDNVVRWTVPSLAPGASTTVKLVATAHETIVNDRYGVRASEGYSATGQVAVKTIVILPPGNPNYNFEFIDQLGGATEAVFVAGDYAYVGEGSRLTILDVSTPASPTVVGKTDPLQDLVKDVYLDGQYAYVVVRDKGLSVIDVSNPAHPTKVGFYPSSGDVRRVAVSGPLVYLVGFSQGLQVIDVSDPSRPVGLGSTIDQATGIAVSGTIAYVIDEVTGLHIVDVSDPNFPTQIGHLSELPWGVRDIALSGTTVYATTGGVGSTYSVSGLYIIDVSDPINPTQVGLYPLQNPIQSPLGGVSVSNGVAYVAEPGSGLHLIDVSDPSYPTAMGFYPMPDVAESFVSQGSAYVAAGGGGLRVVDVQDPDHPAELGFYRTLGAVRSVHAVGDLAFATNANGELWAMDVSDPAHAVALDVYETPGSAVEVYVPGDPSLVYVADGESGLRLLDASVPTDLVEIGAFHAPDSNIVNVHVSSDTAYLVDYRLGLHLLDVSDPANPGVQSFYQLSDALRVFVSGDTAYALDTWCDKFNDCSLRIIDASDPISPAEVAYYRITAFDVSVSDDIAYIGTIDGLELMDVSDPTTPTPIGAYTELFFHPDRIALSGSTVHAIDYTGLWVIDARDPTHPTQAGFYEIPGYPLDVHISDGITYVAGGGGGLFILRHADTSTIAGQVKDAYGSPFAGVTIATDAGLTAITDASGHYRFANLFTQTLTLTPSLPGYTFHPPTRTVSVPPDAAGQDFTVLAAPVSTTLPLSGTANPPASLTYTDTQGLVTRLDFSPGAFSRPTQVTLRPILASGGPGWAFAGHAFELTAYQAGSAQLTLRLQRPVTVTLHYSDADVALVSDEAQLALLRWSGQAWQDAAQTCDPPSTYARDLEQNALSVPICHLSRFGLFGPTHQVYLPLALRAR